MKPVIISLSPNTFPDDVFLAVNQLFFPFSWKKGEAIGKIEQKFKEYFKVPFAFSFNSGRSALQVGLQALALPKGSEVILQAFSCVVVANSVRFAGLKPVFVDIRKNSFSLDVVDLEKKITSKTKAIIVQNLFGIPDDLQKILKIAKKHKLILIEDCAQSLGATFGKKKIGQFGKFAFFSSGRDKVISSVFGGVLITGDKFLAARVKRIYQKLDFPSSFWIFKQLGHPIIFSLVIPAYFCFRIGKFSLGKGILFLMQKIGLLDFPVKRKEKIGEKLKDYPKKLPNGLATLLLKQFNKLEEFNKKRPKIAQYYINNLSSMKNIQFPKLLKDYRPIFLRFPILVEKQEKLLKFAKKRKIILGNWYSKVIAPKGTNLKRVGYKLGSCPNAERAVKKVINLPTYPKMSLSDAERVIGCLKKFYG